VDAIRAEREVRSIWLSWRLPDEEDEVAYETADLPQGLIWGERPAEDVVVTERGLKVGVRPWEGPDVGLYCDMRDLRAWLEPHWHNRRVLNTFAYTGMFSLAAAAGGAKHVTSVDLSEKYLDRARTNFRLNGLDDSRHEFDARDTFKALDAWRRKGDRFDIVIVDPPSFSHSPEGTWSSRKDLPRMVAAALRVTEPGGWLVVCSNQGKVSPKDFQKQIQAGAQKAERSLRLIHQGSQPLDFPAALDFPESRYLKCWVLQG
jgi:23S rRNA (cytosine1962-C5)-methyltransferase